MNSKSVLFLSLLLFLPLFFTAGCGYHMGSMMHPQIRSIAFSDIRNDTREPLLTAIVRNQLAAQFQTDNSLKLKSKDDADCILYCRIVSISTRSIREDSYDNDKTYRPTEFSVSLTAEFTVLIPGRSEPLIPRRTVSASATYQYHTDPTVGKHYGMRQAAYNLANQIVEYTTEAW